MYVASISPQRLDIMVRNLRATGIVVYTYQYDNDRFRFVAPDRETATLFYVWKWDELYPDFVYGAQYH